MAVQVFQRRGELRVVSGMYNETEFNCCPLNDVERVGRYFRIEVAKLKHTSNY